MAAWNLWRTNPAARLAESGKGVGERVNAEIGPHETHRLSGGAGEAAVTVVTAAACEI
eukprot:CAMPEP_0114566012 /NCGR_PEP_ID=MMETSP0114-20121206/14644_1 /TAXON_ID=31324 /ORGANISM="Goniomonas sp, Strain m" /LENGTH=57 /DNA_ID=CAMNT_0001752353 /DNA_START=181 /DNA_END=355 /DNA_ORIENTATION=-